MTLFDNHIAVLDQHLPGLATELGEAGLEALEADGSGAIAMFRRHRGPGLLVPQRHGGAGATAVEATRCARALGMLAPSLSVATTMHNFSVAALVTVEENFSGFEWMLLDAIANDRLLMSSGFAEGRTGQSQLKPSMRAVRRGKDWIVNGSKKPCSLAHSMDLMSASVELIEDGSEPQLGVIVIPAKIAGLEVRPFWQAAVIRGAESDEVVLTDVVVPDELVMKPAQGVGVSFEEVQAKALIWFSLLISASYIGMASALVQQSFLLDKGTAQTRVTAASELEAAMLTLERVSALVDERGPELDLMPSVLLARYATQDALGRSVNTMVECLGGMQFIRDPMVGYLATATHALAFHPPSRSSMTDEFEGFFNGQQLSIV